MIGVQGAMSTLRRLIRPPWAPNDQDFLDVLVGPSLVQWDYVPFDTQTWRIIRVHGEHVQEAYETTTPGEMFAQFLRDNLPRPDQCCVVLDDFGKVVLGWVNDGESTAWVGCAWSFGVLERVHNPVDVALWETNARATYEMERTLRRSTRAE